jgi:hypothetical protein
MEINSADGNGLTKIACFTVTWASGAKVHGSQYQSRITLLRMRSGYWERMQYTGSPHADVAGKKSRSKDFKFVADVSQL